MTNVVSGKAPPQVAPQSIPGGVDTTVPTPVPARTTVRPAANAAVTALSASITIVHVPSPAHAPDQPVNAEPSLGCARSVKLVPDG